MAWTFLKHQPSLSHCLTQRLPLAPCPSMSSPGDPPLGYSVPAQSPGEMSPCTQHLGEGPCAGAQQGRARLGGGSTLACSVWFSQHALMSPVCQPGDPGMEQTWPRELTASRDLSASLALVHRPYCRGLGLLSPCPLDGQPLLGAKRSLKTRWLLPRGLRMLGWKTATLPE